MAAKHPHILEGYGPLDIFLAKKRYKTAISKIKKIDRTGRLLDLGCGSYPLFLINVDFGEKHGTDREVTDSLKKIAHEHDISLVHHDFDQKQQLPYEDNYFDVVTMLAVVEHLDPDLAVGVHREIHRVLKPGGIYVLTTPAWWTDFILKVLAKVHLISDISSGEHEEGYSVAKIAAVLEQADFDRKKMRFGHFELFMNIWASATK